MTAKLQPSEQADLASLLVHVPLEELSFHKSATRRILHLLLAKRSPRAGTFGEDEEASESLAPQTSASLQALNP